MLRATEIAQAILYTSFAVMPHCILWRTRRAKPDNHSAARLRLVGSLTPPVEFVPSARKLNNLSLICRSHSSRRSLAAANSWDIAAGIIISYAGLTACTRRMKFYKYEGHMSDSISNDKVLDLLLR